MKRLLPTASDSALVSSPTHYDIHT